MCTHTHTPQVHFAIQQKHNTEKQLPSSKKKKKKKKIFLNSKKKKSFLNAKKKKKIADLGRKGFYVSFLLR